MVFGFERSSCFMLRFGDHRRSFIDQSRPVERGPSSGVCSPRGRDGVRSDEWGRRVPALSLRPVCVGRA